MSRDVQQSPVPWGSETYHLVCRDVQLYPGLWRRMESKGGGHSEPFPMGGVAGVLVLGT